MKISNEFAKSLEDARSKQDRTQAWVAEHADVSVRQYQNLINRGSDTSLSTAMRLAALLNVSLDRIRDDLVSDESDVFRKPMKKHKKPCMKNQRGGLKPI